MMALSQKVGYCESIGNLMAAYRIAAPYFCPNRAPIPKKIFTMLSWAPPLLECGVAEEYQDGILIMRSEEQFGWLLAKAEAGRRGGVASAKARRAAVAKPSSATANASSAKTELNAPSDAAQVPELTPSVGPVIPCVSDPLPRVGAPESSPFTVANASTATAPLQQTQAELQQIQPLALALAPALTHNQIQEEVIQNTIGVSKNETPSESPQNQESGVYPRQNESGTGGGSATPTESGNNQPELLPLLASDGDKPPPAKKARPTGGVHAVYPIEFERAWYAYGRKGDKKASGDAWNKLKLDDALQETLGRAIKTYLAENPEKKYQKDFERFLVTDWRELDRQPLAPGVGGGVNFPKTKARAIQDHNAAVLEKVLRDIDEKERVQGILQ
jgi:hypothetical protein